MEKNLSPDKDTDAGRELVIIVIGSEGRPEHSERAESAAQFTCPTHEQLQTPNVVRISPVDAEL
jgi:hypothetical protein